MLEEKTTVLKRELMGYTGLVEGMIAKSIKGLLERERNLLIELVEKDEPRANRFEIELDEFCTTLIAQFQPKAKDLRTILMIFKMNNDLERMGDHAVNIAQAAMFLIERPQVKPWIDMPRMAEVAIGMLKDSVTAFINEDAELAKSVCEKDDIVDGLRNQISREIITLMSSDPATTERSLKLMKISDNLERIADLSTNICEDVIFMVEGTVIKHHKEE